MLNWTLSIHARFIYYRQYANDTLRHVSRQYHAVQELNKLQWISTCVFMEGGWDFLESERKAFIIFI